MTKSQMINEMIKDLNYGSEKHNQRIVENCAKQPKWVIEKAYDLYRHEGDKVKAFCIACLNK